MRASGHSAYACYAVMSMAAAASTPRYAILMLLLRYAIDIVISLS